QLPVDRALLALLQSFGTFLAEVSTILLDISESGKSEPSLALRRLRVTASLQKGRPDLLRHCSTPSILATRRARFVNDDTGKLRKCYFKLVKQPPRQHFARRVGQSLD